VTHTDKFSIAVAAVPDFINYTNQVWNRLLELRAAKITKELEIRKKQRAHSEQRRQLEALQVLAFIYIHFVNTELCTYQSCCYCYCTCCVLHMPCLTIDQFEALAVAYC
jgi:hypothetical protein